MGQWDSLSTTTIGGVSFRLGRRHWFAFLPLFALNVSGLLFTIHRSGSLIDTRVAFLMIACSAIISLLTAVLLISLFENFFAASRTNKKS